MSYEKLRNDFMYRLSQSYSVKDVQNILSAFDLCAAEYEITKKVVDIIIPDKEMNIVKMYIASKAIENKSKRTLNVYYRVLTMFFKTVAKQIHKISSSDIRAYLYWYKEHRHVKDSSLDAIRSAICTFFAWCTDEEYLERNPAKKISKIKFQPHERQFMTPLQLEKIRQVCTDKREKALVDFMYSTGCRVSEVCDVMITDIDLIQQTVIVQHGKGDKRRTTYLNAESIVSLQLYLESRDDACPYLFVSRRAPHHHLTPHAIQDEVKRILAKAQLPIPVTPHIFRHTAATTALRSGMPIDQVQKFLGHANINTTLIYAKTDDSEVRHNHQKFIA